MMLSRWFDASPRRATPKGHNLHHLHSTASRGSPTATPLRARGAHKIIIRARAQLDHSRSKLAWHGLHPKLGRRGRWARHEVPPIVRVPGHRATLNLGGTGVDVAGLTDPRGRPAKTVLRPCLAWSSPVVRQAIIDLLIRRLRESSLSRSPQLSERSVGYDRAEAAGCRRLLAKEPLEALG